MRLWIWALVAVALLVVSLLPRLLARRGRRVPGGPLTLALAWLAGVWLLVAYGFVVPVPVSVMAIYLAVVIVSLLLYLSSDRDRLEAARRPVVAFLTERRFTPWLAAVVVLIPALVVANLYFAATAPPRAPAFGRTVHPAPPDQIMVHEQAVNLVTVNNPYRRLETTDPEAFRAHVESGREVYYRNCFYCHGDLLAGDGMFAHALNPIPTNFQDAGNIPQLQESFLFWRIAKGGPGLPPEGGPWDSAMPAWEKFLSEEEMWDVVLFLYDFTGYHPRARHETVVEE
ncbi:MAG TPA: cytochrome c [Thermoanaerobaculia bacterium]|nr:cytochrome c [Thermoanaerobaculia bacterium]